MKQDSPTSHVASAVNDGWHQAGSFASSVIAGLLLGLLLDHWLGTKPWLVVTGIVLGSISAFVKLWYYIKATNEDYK